MKFGTGYTVSRMNLLQLLPVKLLDVFENWLVNSTVCVKWNDVWSTSFSVNFGVRQGSVLSPFLFNIYLDDIAKLNNYNSRSGADPAIGGPGGRLPLWAEKTGFFRL